jgi:hypothetical protein
LRVLSLAGVIGPPPQVPLVSCPARRVNPEVRSLGAARIRNLYG